MRVRLHIRVKCTRTYTHPSDITSPMGRILEQHELYYGTGVIRRALPRSTKLLTGKQIKGKIALAIILA